MKRLMTVTRRKRYVETVAFGAPFSLTTPLGIKREVKLSYIIFSLSPSRVPEKKLIPVPKDRQTSSISVNILKL